MKICIPREENTVSGYNKRFLKFLRLLAEMNEGEGLFPRECRVCGTKFRNVAEDRCATQPKGHCFEDCRHLTSSHPFMMLYRHCTCGNTLVVSIGAGAFPDLDSFWHMLQNEAKDSGRDLKEIIERFADQFDCYLLELSNREEGGEA